MQCIHITLIKMFLFTKFHDYSLYSLRDKLKMDGVPFFACMLQLSFRRSKKKLVSSWTKR